MPEQRPGEARCRRQPDLPRPSRRRRQAARPAVHSRGSGPLRLCRLVPATPAWPPRPEADRLSEGIHRRWPARRRWPSPENRSRPRPRATAATPGRSRAATQTTARRPRHWRARGSAAMHGPPAPPRCLSRSGPDRGPTGRATRAPTRHGHQSLAPFRSVSRELPTDGTRRVSRLPGRSPRRDRPAGCQAPRCRGRPNGWRYGHRPDRVPAPQAYRAAGRACSP